METHERRKRILVATDFSEGARRALERGLEFARALGGEVLLLHVVDTSGFYVGGIDSFVNVGELTSRVRDAARADLDRLADEADPGRKTIVRTEVYDGRAAQAIIECTHAEKPVLIVMGTQGRTGIRRLVLGSVAERVVRLAQCDVLVVHAPEAASA